MDLSRIKNFIRLSGGKYILVENGMPELVVMSFEEYERTLKHTRSEARAISMPSPARTTPRDEFEPVDLTADRLRETEFVAPEDAKHPFTKVPDDASVHLSRGELFSGPGLPVRLEDIRLEDLPI